MAKHKVEEIGLNNGAKGLLVHIPKAPVMSYELHFRAGEYLVEDRNKWETPHLLEHVILDGNKRYPDARAFSAELQKNGAYTNAYTSYYSIGYYGEVADFEWQRVLKLQILALAQPLFAQKEFRAEWGNIHDELISMHNNHFRHLGCELSKSFGFNHPNDQERAELMKNVSRADLITHYNRTHTTNNLRFIIAGNLRGRKMKILQLLENFGLPAGERFELSVEPAHKTKKPVFIKNDTVNNVYLILDSYTNRNLGIEQEMALNLLRIMLTETMHSKIFGVAREKGLVYSVNSGHSRSNHSTEWWLSAQVLPENAPALCDIILKEITKAKNSRITDKDLKGVKQYVLGSFQRSLQTVRSTAGCYNRYLFDGYIEDIDSIPARIKSVTKLQMAEALQAVFEDGIGNIGILGGTDTTLAGKLAKQLRPLWK